MVLLTMNLLYGTYTNTTTKVSCVFFEVQIAYENINEDDVLIGEDQSINILRVSMRPERVDGKKRSKKIMLAVALLIIF